MSSGEEVVSLKEEENEVTPDEVIFGQTCKQTAMSIVMRAMERESLADRAWTPIRFVCYSPQVMTVVLVFLYGVFCLLWLAWSLVGFFLGEFGAWLVGLLAIQFVAATVARFATYPGSFDSVKLDVEREYGRRLAHRLENAACAMEPWWIDLHPRARIDIDKESFSRHVDEARMARDLVLVPLLDAMRLVENEQESLGKKKETHDLGAPDWRSLSVDAVEAFTTVRKAIEAVLAGTTGVEAPTERLLAIASNDFSHGRRHILDAATARAAYDLASACRELARTAQLVLPTQRTQSSGDGPGRGALADAAAAVRSVLRAPCPKPLDSAFGLAMLRAELQRSYGATQVWVKTRDGNRVDCCVIPPYFRRREPPSETAGAAAPVATVLFCAPNAVVYESFGMAPRDGVGWVAIYARLGLQVVVWNLRGYGRTAGSPSPAKNGSDAVAVVEYLRSTCNVPSLLVHGESIGGMAATHVAYHFATVDEGSKRSFVSALVADRTFANLAIEAQYLTGLRAAATALPLATCWLSRDCNSLKNFVGASCPKLVATDACDHMIPDQGSLKAGIALFAELGDDEPRRRDLGRHLAISDALGAPPVPTVRLDLLPDPAAPAPWRVSDAGVAHFAACARHIARAARTRRARAEASSSSSCESTSSTPSASDKTKVRLPFFGGPAARRRSRTRNKSGTPGCASRALRPIDGSVPAATRTPSHTDDDHDEDEDEDEVRSGPRRRPPQEPFHTCLDILAWKLLENVDGGCGQALGRALALDLGAVRAWVASYATWPNGAPNKLIDGVVDVWATDDDQPTTSGSDADDDDPENPADRAAAPLTVRAAALALDKLLSQEQQYGSAARQPQTLIDAVDFVARFLRALADRADHNAASYDDDRLATFGTLLVLGCGHNAPYSTHERDAFFKWLHANFLEAAFQANAPPSPPDSPRA